MNVRGHSSQDGNLLYLSACLSSTGQILMAYHVIKFLYNMVNQCFFAKSPYIYLQTENISKNIDQYVRSASF